MLRFQAIVGTLDLDLTLAQPVPVPWKVLKFRVGQVTPQATQSSFHDALAALWIIIGPIWIIFFIK